MKKLLFPIMLFTSISSFSQQKQGEYDLELSHRRLNVMPTLEFGILSSEIPYFVLGGHGQFTIQKNILAQAALGIGSKNSNLELGGMFAFRNTIVNKNGKLYSRTVDSRTVEVLNTNVNVHKLSGFRGGVFRKSGIATYIDMENDNLGFGKSEIEYSDGVNSYTYTIENLPFGFYPSFNFATLGAYGGIYFYRSRNHTNANKETGWSAKGIKNQYGGFGADVLFGSSTVNITKSSKNMKLKKLEGRSNPIGWRLNFEAGLYFNKRQTVGLHCNAEIAQYPGAKGITALAGIGVRINLLDRVATNLP
jgi:hypothetical protein